MRANTLIIHSQNPSGPKFPNEIVRNSRLTQIFPYLSVRWFSFIFAHRNNNKQSDTQVPKNFPTPRTLAQILTEFYWRWFFPPKNSIVLRSVFLVFGDAVSVCFRKIYLGFWLKKQEGHIPRGQQLKSMLVLLFAFFFYLVFLAF